MPTSWLEHVLNAAHSNKNSVSRRRWRAVALFAGAVLGLAAAQAVVSQAQASPESSLSDFSTSFETGQPQPDWTSTLETSGDGATQAWGVSMTTTVGTGPASGYNVKPNVGWTGVASLHYAGHQYAAGHGYAYDKLYDVNIPVTPTTELSYVIFPESTSGDSSDPSTYAAVDVAFTDGTYLSDLNALDQHSKPVNPQGQGTSKILYTDQWNHEIAEIGAVAAGKTIDRILVGYDKPSGPADFSGWLDDIAVTAAPPHNTSTHPTDHVITTRGTNSGSDFSRGNNFPATATPHGFNFWSPATNAGSDTWFYRYQADNNAQNLPRIQAFSLSHEPSPWIGDRQTFQVMPEAGTAAPTANRSARALAFDHANEIAQPDYYGVTFQNGMKTEITPTDHAAMFRFTFTGDASNLVFDNINGSGGLSLDPSGDSISGYTDVASGQSNGATRMYVYAEFDRAAIGSGTLTGGSGSNNVSGYYKFDTSATKVVTMRIATSLMSVAQAKHNLDLEISPTDTFDSIKAQAQAMWDKVLGVITVQGANDDALTTLYSNLYRLNLYPNEAYENTGTADAPVWQHVVQSSNASNPVPPGTTSTETGAPIADGKVFVDNGFWDTYRTEWPLDALLYPAETAQMINGFVQQYKDGGWVARWSAPGYANSMTGTSSDVAFADAYLKGVPGIDVQAMYDAALKDASVAPPNQNVGRKGLDQSIFLGYTPTSTPESASWSLEDYLNDYGIAQMSKKLYDTTDTSDPRHQEYLDNYTYYLNRAQDYVNLFNPAVGFFEGKDASGQWRQSASDFDPRVWGNEFTETDGWNFAFHAVQDGQGLADLYGSRAALGDKLDKFFATPETATFPGSYGNPIHEMREAKEVRLGQWGLSNQVSHHIPYMYDYADEPSKAEAIVREALSRTFIGSDIGEGYPGDEDNGEMSGWQIFSSLGLYPLQMGSPTYAIGSPLFTQATIHLENGKQIVINAHNNSPQNVYVQDLKVNGASQSKVYLTQDQLANGAVLDFDMGPQPSAWGTGDQDVLPSITNGTSAPKPLQDLTGPSHGTASSSDGSDASKLFDNSSNTEVTFTAKTPSITWDFAGTGTGTATYYTLTSSSHAGDPASWELQGSMDNVDWTTLDRRSNQTFAWRQYTRAFPIANSKAYRYYRLRVVANSGQPTTSLSEIELLGQPPATNPNRTLGAALSPQQSVVIPSAGTAATEKLTLDVQATAPGVTHVKVTPDVPQGWTVTPSSTTVTLNSNGSSAEGSAPLTVTVPAGAADGTYTVGATVSAPSTTAVRATASVTVAHQIDFSTGTAAEQPWLWDADSSQIDGGSNRFADNDHYFVYRFPLPADTASGTVTLSIDNEFLVQASSDGQNWTTVLQETQQIRDGSNKADRTIDIAPFLGTDKVVYIRVADSFPQDGWGGRVSHLNVTFK
jgi:predicted alpha-1,2-mannosidase